MMNTLKHGDYLPWTTQWMGAARVAWAAWGQGSRAGPSTWTSAAPRPPPPPWPPAWLCAAWRSSPASLMVRQAQAQTSLCYQVPASPWRSAATSSLTASTSLTRPIVRWWRLLLIIANPSSWWWDRTTMRLTTLHLPSQQTVIRWKSLSLSKSTSTRSWKLMRLTKFLEANLLSTWHGRFHILIWL